MQAQVEALAAALAASAVGEAVLVAQLFAVAAAAERMQEERAAREQEYCVQREAAWLAALEEDSRRMRCGMHDRHRAPLLRLPGFGAVFLWKRMEARVVWRLRRSMADEHAATAQAHARRWAEAQAARVLAQAARRTELVGAVAQQVASMAACEAVYRRLADGALPPRQLRREWVATFVAGTFAPAQEQVGSRSVSNTAPWHCSGQSESLKQAY